MRYILDWTEYEYSPKMDMNDFIRNNDMDENDDRTIDKIKEVMIELYKVFMDENY